MNTKELEEIMIKSLQDFKLDKTEKHIFNAFSETLEDDQLSFVRNKAFELGRPYVQEGGDKAIRVLNWIDKLVRSIQPKKRNNVIPSEACFSPGSSCRSKIIKQINSAIKSIEICVFTISDNNITEAILAAHQRGVAVVIISDNDKVNDKGSDVNYLSEKGVEVILDKSPYHMHHKFSIFDRRILINGSFNWTRSASDVNEENIIITGEPGLIDIFSKQFMTMTKKFK